MHLLGCHCVVGMSSQSWVVYFFHLCMRNQKFRQGLGIAGMSLHSVGQCTDTAGQIVAICRGRNCATNALHISDFFPEGIFFCRHQGSSEDIRMPPKILGAAVHDQVCTQIDGVLKYWCSKGIVTSQKGSLRLGQGRNRRDIGHLQKRVGRRFHPKKCRIGTDGIFHRIKITHVHKGHLVNARKELHHGIV